MTLITRPEVCCVQQFINIKYSDHSHPKGILPTKKPEIKTLGWSLKKVEITLLFEINKRIKLK